MTHLTTGKTTGIDFGSSFSWSRVEASPASPPPFQGN